MRVVVTPEACSPVLDTIDVASVVPDPRASVTAWRDADADALVVDSLDETLLHEIRSASDGQSAPVVLVTPGDLTDDGPVDAVLAPDADADAAADAVDRAITARDYRETVSELFAACRDRDPGHPDADILSLRAHADRAFEGLDDIPPSVFYAPGRHEQ